MRKLILTIFFGLSVLVAPAAVDSTLVRDHSDSIRVSLVTCSPGTEVYEVYGHTALRVEIPSLGVDVAVNYGLFSFEAPNFVWRFIKGVSPCPTSIKCIRISPSLRASIGG